MPPAYLPAFWQTMPLRLPALLALTEADSPALLWLIVGGLMALGPVIHSYIKVFDWFRGKTPDLSQFITRTELAEIRAERDRQLADTLGGISLRMDSVFRLIETLQQDLPAIHRALGRLEGHDEIQTPARRPR